MQTRYFFNFKNKTITWEVVSIYVELANFTAKKFFVIKESRPVLKARNKINKFYMQNIKNYSYELKLFNKQKRIPSKIQRNN